MGCVSKKIGVEHHRQTMGKQSSSDSFFCKIWIYIFHGIEYVYEVRTIKEQISISTKIELMSLKKLLVGYELFLIIWCLNFYYSVSMLSEYILLICSQIVYHDMAVFFITLIPWI